MLRHKGAEFRLYGGEAVPAPLKGDCPKRRHPEARGFSRVRLHYFVNIQKETNVKFTLSNLLQEIVYNIEAERLFEQNRRCGACAVILTAGDWCLSAEVMMNHEMTEEYKRFLEEDMCAYNSYKFGEEMPDWACEHIVSCVYYPGQFNPVYTKEGQKYT